MRRWFVFLACALPLLAQADIYKYIDASGNIIYTDHPVNGARRLNIPGFSNSRPQQRKPEQKSVEPVHIPRIDAGTQGRRDQLRRSILEDEMKAEQQALHDAQTAKKEIEILRPGERADSPSYLQRVSKANDALRLHQDNVDALDKELARMK